MPRHERLLLMCGNLVPLRLGRSHPNKRTRQLRRQG
jgi:hypothetical protein